MYDKKDYTWYLKYKHPLSANLVDPDEIRQGYMVTHTGRYYQDSNFAHSDYLPIQPGVWYDGFTTKAAPDGAFLYIAFYDLEKKQNGGLGGESGTVNMSLFQAPANAYFARVSFYSESNGQPSNEVGLVPRVAYEYPAMFMPYYFERLVTPIYKSLSREWKQNEKYNFYREELKGNIKLVRKDYEYLDGANLEDVIKVLVVDQSGKLPDFKGLFYKTDCKWDGDSKIVEITIAPDDDYAEIIGGMDKTFNLIELGAEREEIMLKRRPIIQVYVLGDTVLTNISGSMYREQELQVDPVFDEATMINTYHFYKSKDEMIIAPTYFSEGNLSVDVTGTYVQAVRQDGAYALNSKQGTVGITYGRYYEIMRVSDSAIIYRTPSYPSNHVPPWSEIEFKGSLGDVGATGSFFFTELEIFARILYGQPYIYNQDGTIAQENIARPEPDIVEANRNYPWCSPFDTINFFEYDGLQDEPSPFGRVPDGIPGEGRYYKEYAATNFHYPLPISPSNWKALSIWYYNGVLERWVEFLNAMDVKFRDAYSLRSVLSALLRAVGSPVTYAETLGNSEVLNATENPLGAFSFMDFDTFTSGQGNTATAGNLELFITPKSNVLGNYDEAARKAEITLARVLNMLRDTFKIYPHVKDRKLILEHISWYQKGGSYTTPIVGADLTELLQLRNEKKWGFAQNKWEFDKENMPERFEYGWMDDVSEAFEGYPIQIRSRFVQHGRIENMAIESFTTDYDYVTQHPSDVSKDGFCLLGAVRHNGELRVPFVEYENGVNKFVVLQNGLLAWVMLHLRYHVYDLPADRVNINNEDLTLLENITKKKNQEVRFPGIGIDLTFFDPYKLVKTQLGDGIIEELKIDMGSYAASATIKHDTQ